MMQKYTTKRDINGNRKTLIIDHEAKTVKRDYNTSHCYDDYITVSNRDRLAIYDSLIAVGYTSI